VFLSNVQTGRHHADLLAGNAGYRPDCRAPPGRIVPFLGDQLTVAIVNDQKLSRQFAPKCSEVDETIRLRFWGIASKIKHLDLSHHFCVCLNICWSLTNRASIWNRPSAFTAKLLARARRCGHHL